MSAKKKGKFGCLSILFLGGSKSSGWVGWLWRIPAIFIIYTTLWVIAYKWIDPPTTYLHLTCDCPEGVGVKKEWVDGGAMADKMKLAVVASEDNRFMMHGGIDWDAVEKARKYNETEGKKKGKYRGASTITQQTAKNVFLWPGKSKISKWIRKGFELYFTYMIEWIWGKERILEVYLNVIEMGPCIFGVEAASNVYFGKKASQLTPEQAALIAACLPNPVKYSVSKPGPYMRKRQTQIVKLMNAIGNDYFTRAQKAVEEKERKKKKEEILKSIPEEDLPTVDIDTDKDEPAGDDSEVPPANADSLP
jgi:monofunctional biosynthetic peptidoglycan transglycosylase